MCGGGESRHQESGLKTNRSVLFNWNLKFQGKVWKVKSQWFKQGVMLTLLATASLGPPGTMWCEGHPAQLQTLTPSVQKQSLWSAVFLPWPMSPQTMGMGMWMPTSPRTRWPWGSCLQEWPPGPLRSLLVTGAAHRIQVSRLFLNIFPLHASKSSKKPLLKQNFYQWKGSIARDYEPL